jgi:hypothetical protein
MVPEITDLCKTTDESNYHRFYYTGLQNVRCFLSHKKNEVILIVFCMLNSNITLVSLYHARFSSDTHFKFEENVCFEQFKPI